MKLRVFATGEHDGTHLPSGRRDREDLLHRPSAVAVLWPAGERWVATSGSSSPERPDCLLVPLKQTVIPGVLTGPLQRPWCTGHRELLGWVRDRRPISPLDEPFGAVVSEPLPQEVNCVIVRRPAGPPAARRLFVEARLARACLEPEVTETADAIDRATGLAGVAPSLSVDRRGYGPGVGLPSVNWIRPRSRGVGLEVPGSGTCYGLLLLGASGPEDGPRAEPAPVDGTATGERIRRIETQISSRATVLVAEDVDLVRRLARRILERAGYRVLEATDGEEALRVAAAEGGEIDLLLSDVLMPRLGGPDLAERFLRQRPGTPVVFMSGYPADPEFTDHLPEATLLQKPFEPRDLLALVAERLKDR